MRSALPLPSIAPSSTLLRFLKSQSESLCFFSSNPGPGFTFDHAAPRGAQLLPRRSRCPAESGNGITRAEAPRILKAGLLNLDFLCPGTVSSSRSYGDRISRIGSRDRGLAWGKASCGCRAASTGSRRWHLWEKRDGKPLQPDDLPKNPYASEDGGDTSMFSLGRSISAKAAAQPKLRCTELDEVGNVSMASGEFKKSELIAKVRKQDSIIQGTPTKHLQ